MPSSDYPRGYTPQLFPFAAIFEQLTRELQAKDAHPVEAYVRFQQLRRQADLRSGADYCSTSITSGGHARRNDLNSLEIIRRNTLNARQLVAEMTTKGTLHARSAILPVDLGYVPSWQQSDYISFWLAVIAGLDLGTRVNGKSLAAFVDRLHETLHADKVDLELMNNRDATPQTRAPEYFKFARAWAQITAHFRPEPHSAHRVINLIDTHDSLGCQTERLFAKLRGIPIYTVRIAGPGPEEAAFRDHTLYEDLQTIVSYGGTTVTLDHHNLFVLKQVPDKQTATR